MLLWKSSDIKETKGQAGRSGWDAIEVLDKWSQEWFYHQVLWLLGPNLTHATHFS